MEAAAEREMGRKEIFWVIIEMVLARERERPAIRSLAMDVEGKAGQKKYTQEKNPTGLWVLFDTEGRRVKRINDQVNFKHILLMALLILRGRKSEGVNLSFLKLEFEIPGRWISITREITEFFITILRFK